MRLLHPLHKASISAVLACCTITGSVSAQILNTDLCKAFHAAMELYVIDQPSNTGQLATSSGKEISFAQLVQEAWPDKLVKVITEEEYDKLPNVKDQFHITNSAKSHTLTHIRDRNVGNTNFSEIRKVRNHTWEFIVLQKGKAKLDHSRVVNLVYLDWRSISDGLLAERLEFGVHTMKEQTALPAQGKRDKYSYMAEDIKALLRGSTLYVWTEDLVDPLRKEGALSSVYPHSYQVVGYDKIHEAISQKQEGILYMEDLDFGDSSCIHIREASTGRLVYSASPIIGPPGSRVKAGIKGRLTKL